MISLATPLPSGAVVVDDPFVDFLCFASPGDYLAVAATLRADGFELCVDICGVDYLDFAERSVPAGVTPTRFEVVTNLLSISRRQRARIRVQAGNEAPMVDSLFSLYPGAEAPEREVFDMFGVLFDGHPELTRILMPEDWEGHPLRKDFGLGRVPVQFKGAPGPR